MHMKDLTDFTAKESQVAVGEGILPVRAIFEALIAIQYPGFVDLEYEIHADDPMPGVIDSFAYMRGVLAAWAIAALARGAVPASARLLRPPLSQNGTVPEIPCNSLKLRLKKRYLPTITL